MNLGKKDLVIEYGKPVSWIYFMVTGSVVFQVDLNEFIIDFKTMKHIHRCKQEDALDSSHELDEGEEHRDEEKNDDDSKPMKRQVCSDGYSIKNVIMYKDNGYFGDADYFAIE